MIKPITLPKIEYGEGLTHVGQAFNEIVAPTGFADKIELRNMNQPKVNAVETFRKDWNANKKSFSKKEVFGLSGRESMLANKEAESEADKAIRISEEKADWDSSFGYDEWRDNQD